MLKITKFVMSFNPKHPQRMYRGGSMIKSFSFVLIFIALFVVSATSCHKNTGSIQISSTPTGARIYLDNADTGQITNATLPSIPAGEHSIRLVLEGYYEESASVTVTAGETTQVHRTLTARSSGSAGLPYDIGSPSLTDLYVATTGNDSNSGASRAQPLQTLSGAWNRIASSGNPTTGFRIHFLPGSYPCEGDCLNYFSDRAGTYQYPIILQPADGAGTVNLLGGLNLARVSFVYIFDLSMAAGAGSPAWGNNVFHCENCDHLLLRGVTLTGPDPTALPDNYDIQEVIKINQSQDVYIESCDISGSYQTGVDFFSVQYGHLLNNRIHAAGEWVAYFKGGSAYLRVEGNEFYSCGLGLQAGEGSNFEVMRAPWLHYEAYDVKAVNNIFHDIGGVALSVAGGYNILYAFNTLYRIGTRSEPAYSLFQFVHGSRVCYDTSENGENNAAQLCGASRNAGGWCPPAVGMDSGCECIPNRNVYVYNNIFYNPGGTESVNGHISVQPEAIPPAGSNIPSPSPADRNVHIKANIIWNGAADHALGIDETTGCLPSNTTCNEAQILADNTINAFEPQLANPGSGDFRPTGSSNVLGIQAEVIPDFIWSDAPAEPPVPAGTLSNAVTANRDGTARSTPDHPGAY